MIQPMLKLANYPLYGKATTPLNTISQVSSLMALITSIIFGIIKADKQKPLTIICTLIFIGFSLISLIAATALKSTSEESKKLNNDLDEIQKKLTKTENELQTATTKLTESQTTEKIAIDDLSGTIDTYIVNNGMDTGYNQAINAYLTKIQSIINNPSDTAKQTEALNQLGQKLVNTQNETLKATENLIQNRQELDKQRAEVDKMLKEARDKGKMLRAIIKQIGILTSTISNKEVKTELDAIKLSLIIFQKNFLRKNDSQS